MHKKIKSMKLYNAEKIKLFKLKACKGLTIPKAKI